MRRKYTHIRVYGVNMSNISAFCTAKKQIIHFLVSLLFPVLLLGLCLLPLDVCVASIAYLVLVVVGLDMLVTLGLMPPHRCGLHKVLLARRLTLPKVLTVWRDTHGHFDFFFITLLLVVVVLVTIRVLAGHVFAKVSLGHLGFCPHTVTGIMHFMLVDIRREVLLALCCVDPVLCCLLRVLR